MKENGKAKKQYHLSTGGFVFYKEKETGDTYTLLVKNKRGEYWIPKGHLEEGEEQISAAYREIEEETTLEKRQLKYAGFCTLLKYSFEEDGIENVKEVYINVFEALEKRTPTLRSGETEIFDIRWLKYVDALKTISYGRDDLEKSKEIFERYLTNPEKYFYQNTTSKQRAVGVVIRDNKLLTFYRIKDRRKYFVFPGGSVEDGETAEEALVRELKEEMCIDIKNPILLFDFFNKVEGYDHGRTNCFYLVNDFDGEPELGGPEKERMNENDQFYVHWLNLSDLSNINNLYPEEAKNKLIDLFKNNKL